MQRAKRPSRYVKAACTACRDSKVRCDGQTPICGNCCQRGRLCKYASQEDKRKVSLKTAVHLLAARVNTLTDLARLHNLTVPEMDPGDREQLTGICETLRIQLRDQQQDQPLPPSASLRTDQHDFDGFVQQTTTTDDSLQHSFQVTNMNVGHSLWSDSHAGDYSWTSSPTDWLWQWFDPLTGPDFSLPDEQNNLTVARQIPFETQRSVETSESTTRRLRGEDHASIEDDHDVAIVEELAARLGSLHVISNGKLRYFGTATNYHILENLQNKEMMPPDAFIRRTKLTDDSALHQPVPHPLQSHLLELYFLWHNCCHSIVDQTIFQRACEASGHDQKTNEFYSDVLLNAICAVGALSDTRYHVTFVTYPRTLSEHFASKAKMLLEFELDDPCVATVQALILLSNLEASNGNYARMSLYSGMALRLSLDLGLQVNCASYVRQGILSDREAAARHATFRACAVINYLWSFYLGRPSHLDGDDMQSQHNQLPDFIPSNAPNRLSMNTPHDMLDTSSLVAQEWYSLCDLMAPLTKELYGSATISKIVLQELSYKTTSQLDLWRTRLPTWLTLQTGTVAPPNILLLHMGYHHFRILSHRPWTSKASQPTPDHKPGFMHARLVCISSASAIKSLLQDFDDAYGFKHLSVYGIHIIFSAALISIFRHASQRDNTHDKSPDSAATEMQVFFKALDELSRLHEFAAHVRIVLLAIQKRWHERQAVR